MNSALYDRAMALATEAHAGQLDKAGYSYIEHPIRVASNFTDERVKIIAILHDVVEDSPITLADLSVQFGDEIAVEVDALTRREGEEYMEYIRRAGSRPLSRQVKLADLKDNMNVSRLKSITLKDQERLERYEAAYRYLTGDSR